MEPLLLVEDKNELRAMLRKALERNGFSVDEAPDGSAAIQKLRSRRYQLVITDLKMPGAIDGLDLVEWLQCALPAMPVIVTTGYHSLRTQVNGLPVFEKPYRFDRLVDRVCEMLNPP